MFGANRNAFAATCQNKEKHFLSLYEGQSFSFFSRLCNSRDLGKNKQGDSAKVGFSPFVATRTADLNTESKETPPEELARARIL